MPDFWSDSGFNLAQRSSDGRLIAGDALLQAWWCRPEVEPVPESCDAELALHAALLADPRRPVKESDLAAMKDPDARENYRVVLAWRERLVAAPSLEAAYLGLFRNAPVASPPLFIDQLARIILHGILEKTDDPLELRAAELFFRMQKVSLKDGALLLADAEIVERHETGGNFGQLGRMLVEARINPRKQNLDVLDRDNADVYWDRSERHDTAISFKHSHGAIHAFCRVIEKWVRHFYGADVAVHPLSAIDDQQWAWHIGLDAEASAILNDLYRGNEVDEERKRRLLSLFRLEFADSSLMRPNIAGRPVYLGCAMDERGILRIKPQNLLLNLPLASIS